jgi:ABC-type multidrug transport system fused ATPase/permease subunit
MDRIIVLDQGRIVEEGPPALLLQSGGAFARAWSLQHDAA